MPVRIIRLAWLTVFLDEGGLKLSVSSSHIGAET